MQQSPEETSDGIKSIGDVGFAEKADSSCSEIEGQRQKKGTNICRWEIGS